MTNESYPSLDDNKKSTVSKDIVENSHRAVKFKEKLYGEIIRTVADLIDLDPSVLDLKITRAAIREMTDAFKTFKPYRDRKKLTIFGSARTETNDPLYIAAVKLANLMAQQGWMVVTGAGPGIMEAGMVGAGSEQSIGVNIRLPHEQEPNTFIAHDPKLVSMRYFFTRKLMLIKESRAYVSFPGGYGTLDETFELLTLIQTGKAEPAPVILLELAGERYWKEFDKFVKSAVLKRNYISEGDPGIYEILDSPERAVRYIEDFYSVYDSIRWVGSDLVIRINNQLEDSALVEINKKFKHIVLSGQITRTEALPVELADQDKLDKFRIKLKYNRQNFSELISLIKHVNQI